MQIEPNSQVKLLRLQCVGGNIYHPRIYQAAELPPELLQEGIVTQDFVTKPAIPPIAVQGVQMVNVTLKQAEPNVQPPPYPTASLIDAVEKVAINRATIDELGRLPGVGISTASRLAALREDKPFASAEDLNERIPLKKGNWDNLAGRLLF